MQFVADGPDVPEELLQAHEEGRVVFFCGAGISYPAGLPGFEGLVEEIYKRSGTTKSEIELEAFKSGKYDATLDLLERRLPGQRVKVSYFSELLAKHLRTTSHVYAQGFGSCICGTMQGLVYENPGKPLPELRLDKERTKALVRQVEHQAVDQVLKAGYSIEQAFENREVVRDLISKFFITNGFLSASK
jgi:hypothetical protein